MGKKSSTGAASKISSAAAPAVSSATTTTGPRPALLKSAFAPSHLQLQLFASVIQSFETQDLRIHDINTGRLRYRHAVKPGTSVTSLEWGYYGAAYRESLSNTKKKRKRDQEAAKDVVIAYGTSTAEICMYSPTEDKVVGQLRGAHDKAVKDFKFCASDYLQGWSVGEDGKLVQWDLAQDQPTRVISLPDPAVTVLASPTYNVPEILCASQTPFSIDFASSDDFRIQSFDSFKKPVQALFRSGTDASLTPETFLAADTDRYINIYHLAQKRLVRTLVAGSEVEDVELFMPISGTKDALQEQILAVLTRDGIVELFSHPFAQSAPLNGDLKLKRKAMTRKAEAQIKIVKPESRKGVHIFAASFQGADLWMASTLGGVDMVFQKIRWQDEATSELLFQGMREISQNKAASTLIAATTNGVNNKNGAHVDESKLVVVNGAGDIGSQIGAIEILSSDGEADDIDEHSASESGSDRNDDNGLESTDGTDDGAEDTEASDQEMVDAEENVPNDQSEPSFGELAAKHQGTISIIDALPGPSSLVETGGSKSLPLSTGMSLGTVLTQALKTNDRNLLESCLHATDAGIVQNTIQRLDSSMAGLLLSKLAERLSSSPGRYGHLLTWVQWTCIVHGGAITSQPDVTDKIRTLYRVLTQRSRSLDDLLLLKGKLDMLDAQLTYRKQLQAQRGQLKRDQDEPGMIYIEGGEDNWTSEDDVDESALTRQPIQANSRKAGRKALDKLVENDEVSDDEEMPLVNGMTHSDSEAEDEESDPKTGKAGRKAPAGGIFDVEAEVSDEDEDDDDSGEEEDEDDDEDSEMDSFINDGSISEVDDENDVDISGDEDDEAEVEADVLQRPAVKKSRRV